MERVLAGTSSVLVLVTYDGSGDPVDSGVGDGAANIYASDGTLAAGPLVASNTATGTYEATLPSTLVVLDRYRVAWSLPDGQERATYFQLVGSFLFSQAELRALDPVLADETDFPDATIVEARENAEQRFEEAARVSFTLRGTRVYLDGNGYTNRAGDGYATTGIQELRSVVSCSIDGTALTGTDLSSLIAQSHGTVVRPSAVFPVGSSNVEMLVEHGFVSVPEPVRRAGLLYTRTVLLRSALEQSDRATAVFTDIGGYRLTLAGRDGPTGIPEVDAVLSQFGRRPAGVFA